MKWVKNLFSRQSVANKPESLIDTNKKKSSSTLLSSSKPINTNNDSLPSEILKKFIPLRDLDEGDIKLVTHTTQEFNKESILFLRSQKAEKIYYLLKGTVEMSPDSDNCYEITSADTRALLPLNSGSFFGATATANTDVTLLLVSAEINQLWADRSHNEISSIELIDIEFPQELNDIGFFDSFAQAYRQNQLGLPSLPDVAFKLKQAMVNNIGVNEAVEIIQLDSSIVTKLIQVANSSLYASVSPIKNCHDAVVRLGLAATRNLVISISLKQLFQCEDKQLMKGMQNLWKNSLYVSSLSFVLASETGIINPDDALLAGLICDIGSIPLLHFAEQHPSTYPDYKDLEIAMPYLRAPVGTLVLHTLGFPEELSSIPHHAEDWFYDSGADLTLIDIVILAKLHSYISNKNTKGLPYINSIPAYSKLKEGKLNPDFSLQVLHKAQKRINSAIRMLS